MQSLTLVGPPSFLCLMWWTSETAAGRSQPPGQAQCWSRWMTACRIGAGLWSEWPDAGLGLLAVEGAALAGEGGAGGGGAQGGGDPVGAGDEVDREPPQGVQQRLPLLRRQRLE